MRARNHLQRCRLAFHVVDVAEQLVGNLCRLQCLLSRPRVGSPARLLGAQAERQVHLCDGLPCGRLGLAVPGLLQQVPGLVGHAHGLRVTLLHDVDGASGLQRAGLAEHVADAPRQQLGLFSRLEAVCGQLNRQLEVRDGQQRTRLALLVAKLLEQHLGILGRLQGLSCTLGHVQEIRDSEQGGGLEILVANFFVHSVLFPRGLDGIRVVVILAIRTRDQLQGLHSANDIAELPQQHLGLPRRSRRIVELLLVDQVDCDHAASCCLNLLVFGRLRQLECLLSTSDALLRLIVRHVHAGHLLQHNGLPLGITRLLCVLQLLLSNLQRLLRHLVLQMNVRKQFQRGADQVCVAIRSRRFERFLGLAESGFRFPRCQKCAHCRLQGVHLPRSIADLFVQLRRLQSKLCSLLRTVRLCEVCSSQALQSCGLAFVVAQLAAQRLRLLGALHSVRGVALGGVRPGDSAKNGGLLANVAELSVQRQRLVCGLQGLVHSLR
mmetsp:Transcript_54258/g.176297  ORF Transcript_54258/g.176297 Transcript_54258/m.176297 type:complete len:493 (+) Transcript_54258:917-2395(+)